MPKAKKTDDGLTKFQRSLQHQQHRGMKLLRVWASDPRLSEFASEARRQGGVLSDAPEEAEALLFIESAFEWPES